MTNPTSNYNFQMPTATDLVTDLPADFEVFGQAVDTRLKALQPGTTLGDLAYSSATANTNTRLAIGTSGQVLAVSGGGVPAWTTTADVTPLTTKGDLFTFSTADARLPVGTNGQVLTADSTEATGLKYTTISGGSWTQAATGSLTGSSITVSSLSGQKYYVLFEGISNSASEYTEIRFNGVTSSSYLRADSGSAVASLYTVGASTFATADTPSYGIFVDMANTSMAAKPVFNITPKSTNGSVGGWFKSSNAITSITFFTSPGSFDAGTYYVWSFA